MSTRSHFPATLPQQHTKYCFQCGAETITKIINETKDGPQTKFLCTTCQQVSDRVRIWDPEMIQYFDDNNNLVHDGAGMIVQNSAGQILFFLRTKYPFL